MSTPITVFDVETGDVVRTERINMGKEPIGVAPGTDWIVGYVDRSAQLVDPETGEAMSKPDMEIAISGNVLSGIPVGAVIMLNFEKDPEPIEDGDFEIVVDHPQIVHVVLQHPRFQAWEREVACAPGEG